MSRSEILPNEKKVGRGRVVFVLIMSQVVISATYLMAKVALREFSPLALGLYRFFLAALVMTLAMKKCYPGIRVDPADRKTFFWMALLVIPLNQGIFLYAMKYAPAAHGALFYSTTPIMVLFLSAFFLAERLTISKAAGIALGFSGVVLVLFDRGLHFAPRAVWGDLLLLPAVATWAVYTILNKKMVKKYPPLVVTAYSFIVGLLLFLPLGVPVALKQDYSQLTWMGIGAVLYLALMTSVLCYWVWSWALSRLEASRVAVVSNLQPVFAAGWGWLLLGETVTVRFVAGAALVFAGVILAERGWNRSE